MKRKIIMGLLTVLTVGTLFVGCGSTPSANNNKNSEVTNEDNQNTTSESETNNNSGTVGDVVDETEVLVRTYTFPSMIDATGYMVKTIEDENVDWSSNETYVKLSTGNVMTFKWESPIDCGAKVNSNGNTVFIKNTNGHLELHAWTMGWTETEYEDVKAMSKEDIVTVATNYTYPENGYYEYDITDTVIRVTFAIDDKENESKGYARYIVDMENKFTYQFAYLETSDFYSDSRAFDVINSIEYANLPATPAE